MAHELEVFEDGTAAFFAARTPGWHQLGTVTADALTAEDALHTAYLDWTVYKSDAPVGAPINGGTDLLVHDSRFLIYRDQPKGDGYDVLGIAGSQFTPIQNSESFAFLDLVADESGAHFDTAGSLHGGRKVFMSMKLPEAVMIGGQDAHDLYLLAWNSHDGTGAFHVIVTPVRVVCQNTLTAGIRRAKAAWSIRHDRNVAGKIAAARDTLEMTFAYKDAFTEEANRMLDAEFTRDQFDLMVADLVPMTEGMTDRAKDRVVTTRESITGLWTADTQKNIIDTRWAAWNAVVEWADWYKPTKNKDEALGRATRVVADLAAFDRTTRPLDVKRKAWRMLATV